MGFEARQGFVVALDPLQETGLINTVVYQFSIFIPRLRSPLRGRPLSRLARDAESAGEPDQPVMRTGSVFKPRRTRLSL